MITNGRVLRRAKIGERSCKERARRKQEGKERDRDDTWKRKYGRLAVDVAKEVWRSESEKLAEAVS